MPGQPTPSSSAAFTPTTTATKGSVVTINFHFTQLIGRAHHSRAGWRWPKLVALGLLCAACSKQGYQGHGVKWEPPRGVKMSTEIPEGAGAVIEFTGGVQLSVLDAKEHEFPRSTGDENLDEIASVVVPQGVKVISKRSGQVPAGGVARFVWLKGSDKTCLYYLPHAGQVVLVSLTAPSATFGTEESQFDLSLAKLSFE